jgi:hypothetical protein
MEKMTISVARDDGSESARCDAVLYMEERE